MLKRKFDMLTVGRNYLAYIYSLDLLNQGRDVVLIDDNRLAYGDLYLGAISQLEKSFLQKWGRENKIEPFINFERYLKKEPYTVILGGKRIRLGDQPSRNYLELARKLSFCFLSGDSKSAKKQFSRQNYMNTFDSAYEELCWGVTQKLYGAVSTEAMEVESLMEQCPRAILQIYEDFVTTIENESEMSHRDLWNMRTFLYMLRGYHQKKLSFEYSKVQLFHLLLGLLSPSYKVDTDALISDLHLAFLTKGGEYRETKLADWRFFRSRPWCVQLQSFEGILHPQNISLFGGELNTLPLKYLPQEMMYNCLRVEWQLKRSLNIDEKRIVYSAIEKIGTDQSIWELNILDSRTLRFNVFFVSQLGCKVSFLADEVRERLLREMQIVDAISQEDIVHEKMEFGNEVWIEERLDSIKTMNLKKRGKHHFALFDASHSHSLLKSVDYFGPSKNSQLGLLSSLMEIKSHASGV